MRAPLLRAAALCAALAAAPAAAQDVEMLSAASGHPLPAGYYEHVRQKPDFFQTTRGWRARVESLQPVPGGPAQVTLPLRGEMRMLVMLGQFADSPEPPVTPVTVQRQLFGDNPLGNLTDFYRQISGGRVVITGAVAPWVRTSLARDQVVGQAFGLGVDSHVGEYLAEIVARLDHQIDFGQYDNDGPDGIPNSRDDDGFVDVAVFQFGEVAASCGNPGSIWPHKAQMSGWLTRPYGTSDLRPNGEPVRVDDYFMQSAVGCDGSPQTISTIAHETGHAFGLPDFYDAGLGLLPGQRRWVLGCWTLMAGGGWGCGDGASFAHSLKPSQMGPYEKQQLGWVQPTVVQPGWRRTYTLNPVHSSGDVLRIPLVGNFEYLLLEYRQNTGYDSQLPASGVLVYHVENQRPLGFGCSLCQRIYRVMLLEADGDSALTRNAAQGGNRGAPGDVFAGRRVLGDHTHPGTRHNSGLPSNVRLEIDVSGGQAQVVVSTLPSVASAPLLGPLLGSPGGAPRPDEAAALDEFGNRNGRYDMGDLRAYMRNRPGTVTQGP